MKKIIYLFVLCSISAFGQNRKMNFHVLFESGINTQFKLNEVLKDNNLKEIKPNVVGLNMGYIFCPNKIGYYSDLSYQRTVEGSIYQSLGFSVGMVLKQKLFKAASLNYIPYIKLRSHNVNVINSQDNNITPDQLPTVSDGNLTLYGSTFGFGGKVIYTYNNFWHFGLSFDSSVKPIHWEMKNQHISDLPKDDFTNFSVLIGFNLTRK